MNLQTLIRTDVDLMVHEWEGYARTCLPAADNLDSVELRDHARVMLLSFADDMDQAQDEGARNTKSLGDMERNSPALNKAGHDHAAQRFAQGFTLTQMVSEYRALRAAVIRRWTETLRAVDAAALDDVVRFGEAVDQAITESVVVHMEHVEETRSLLLGVLGHDLRNPLGAVRMSAEYLLRTSGLDGNQTIAATRIANSTMTMAKMVEDLLDFTQTMLVRTLPLKVEASNLASICREVVNELVAFHPGRAIHFHEEGDFSGFWDPPRIAQLVSNLAANAIHHGDVSKPVTISLTGQHDTVTVKVHNDGVPIPESARGPLFKPAVHTSAQRKPTPNGPSGLGLGLYIAHEIVLAHKGHVEMESTQREGTTFTVRLPRTVAPDNAA